MLKLEHRSPFSFFPLQAQSLNFKTLKKILSWLRRANIRNQPGQAWVALGQVHHRFLAQQAHHPNTRPGPLSPHSSLGSWFVIWVSRGWVKSMGLGDPGSSAPSEDLENLCVWGGLQLVRSCSRAHPGWTPASLSREMTGVSRPYNPTYTKQSSSLGLWDKLFQVKGFAKFPPPASKGLPEASYLFNSLDMALLKDVQCSPSSKTKMTSR